MTSLTLTPHATKRNTGRRRLKTLSAIVGTFAIALFLAVVPGSFQDSASAATPFSQCNGVDNTPGLGITCSVTITNSFNVATGVGSSVTVVRECHGAGTTAPSSCTTSSRSGTTAITSVSQCNGSINGGGGTVICDVRVTNNITGTSTLAGATVNQCVGSAGGGGTEPTLVCNPQGSTTNATVTQCNGSANGGGGSLRVRCSVFGSTTSSGLSVTINQCNGSANGGGSTVTCTSQVTSVNVAGSSGGSTSSAAAAPSGPTAAQVAQAASNQRSASSVQSSLGSLSSGASSSVRDAAERALARAFTESLAHAGFDAALFVGASSVALLIGATLWIVGRRKNRSAGTANTQSPAHI